MEIEIKVEAEDITKNTRTLTGTVYVTAVALDKDGKPTQVSELVLETDEDRRKFVEGKSRMEQRAKDYKLAKEMAEHG